jgi:hypothetical protein
LGGILVLVLVLMLVLVLLRGLSPVPGARIDHRRNVVGRVVGVGLAVEVRVGRRPGPAAPGKLRRRIGKSFLLLLLLLLLLLHDRVLVLGPSEDDWGGLRGGDFCEALGVGLLGGLEGRQANKKEKNRIEN